MKNPIATFLCFILLNFFAPLAVGAATREFQEVFEKFYARRKLTAGDLKELSDVYRDYSKNYLAENEREMQGALPLVSTNAHHASFYYWLQFAVEHPQGGRVSSLFHLDSHSDLGGVDKILSLGGRKVPLRELMAGLRTKSLPSLAQMSGDFFKGINDYATPIMAALQSQVIQDVILCLPSWNKQIPLLNRAYEVGMTTFGKHFFPPSPHAKSFPTLRKGQYPSLERPSSPFVIISGPYQKHFEEKKVPMHFMDCFFSDWKKAFSAKAKDKSPKGIILGIDLDLFATNGVSSLGSPRPKSYFRDGGQEVSKEEFDRIKWRIGRIIKKLRDLKAGGFRPLLISLADSTQDQEQGPFPLTKIPGGDFTPLPLAFLIHYKLKAELRSLFPAQRRGKGKNEKGWGEFPSTVTSIPPTWGNPYTSKRMKWANSRGWSIMKR